MVMLTLHEPTEVCNELSWISPKNETLDPLKFMQQATTFTSLNSRRCDTALSPLRNSIKFISCPTESRNLFPVMA